MVGCRDGLYMIDFETTFTIDIEKKKTGSKILTPTLLRNTLIFESAQNCMKNILHKASETMTIAQLLTTQLQPQSDSLCGLPITWDGKKKLTINT